MTGSYWKDRFNEKQLERKRLSDKITQRRTRQQCKRTIAELECRLRLMRDGDAATLINWIQQDNSCLRKKIWRYCLQMESTFVQGKECLLQDDASWYDINAPFPTRPATIQPGSIESREPPTPTPSDYEVERRCLAMLFKMQPSLFVELAGLMDSTDVMHGHIAANNLLESIMMWKAKFGFVGNEFAVLLVSLNLDQEPFYLTTEQVHEQALSKYIYQDILQNLLYGEEISPRDLQPDDKISEEAISKMQYQRRAIAYCAYETLRAWRESFKSSLEYTVSFWAQYRYFMLIAFPTIENYHKCPSWRLPVTDQFNHDHPSILDLIVWPELRKRLVITWQQYELPALCLSIARSLEFTGEQVDVASAIRLETNSSDLVLDESFERAVHDISNFKAAVGAPFAIRYPELLVMTTLDLQLFPCLRSPIEEHTHTAPSSRVGHESRMPHDANLYTPPNPPNESQSEESNPAPPGIDLPDLIKDSLTNVPSTLDFDTWTNLLQDQELESIAGNYVEEGHLGSSFVASSPLANMLALGDIAPDWI